MDVDYNTCRGIHFSLEINVRVRFETQVPESQKTGFLIKNISRAHGKGDYKLGLLEAGT